jgi:competence protein ComEC
MLWTGFLNHFLLFLVGYQLTALNTDINYDTHFSKCNENVSASLVHISEPIQIKQNHIKVIADVRALKIGEGWIQTTGKAMLYLKKDVHSNAVNYGDVLLISEKLNLISSPKNPGDFDFKKYFSYKNIYHQAFLNENDWIKTSLNESNKLIQYSLQLKAYLLKSIKAAGLNHKEYAVASALLVGDESELDEEIISAYAQTGVIHVLSVSGMHVGLIYLFVSWMLSFIKVKHGKWIHVFLLLGCIWFYCLITGLAPSALRAGTVLSLVVIGKALYKTVNPLNILAASAFILLCINPYLLMHIGFQLSYFAVLGLILIQPHVYKLMYFKNYLFDKIWTIASVSFSALLATLPLCLYYFHNVPNYFLLTNIIAVPLASLIIYLGVAVCLLSNFQPLFQLLAYPFKYAITALNAIIFKIQQLPYSVLENIHMSFALVVLVYALIFIFLKYVLSKQFGYLVAGLCLIVAIGFLNIYGQYQHAYQKKMIVYYHPKNTLIDFIAGDSLVYIQYENSNVSINSKMLKSIINSRKKLAINSNEQMGEKFKNSFICKYNNYVQFMDKRILILDKEFDLKNYKIAIRTIDYLVVSGEFLGNMQSICNTFSPEMVVFDSSVKRYQLNKWKEQCMINGSAFYSVSDSGAWIKDL